MTNHCHNTQINQKSTSIILTDIRNTNSRSVSEGLHSKIENVKPVNHFTVLIYLHCLLRSPNLARQPSRVRLSSEPRFNNEDSAINQHNPVAKLRAIRRGERRPGR